MLAVVKKHHTSQTLFEVRGDIPPVVVRYLKDQFGPDMEFLQEKEEKSESDGINIFETQWYQKTKAATSPGDTLKIYRENTGLTQTQLGQKLGKCSRQKISDMERGKRNISKELAKKFSQIFDISADRFL